MVSEKQPDNSWQPDAQPKLAEEASKNIQVMKGLTASRLMPVMNLFTKWLGVECVYCHVPNDFPSDESRQTNSAQNAQDDNFPGEAPGHLVDMPPQKQQAGFPASIGLRPAGLTTCPKIPYTESERAVGRIAYMTVTVKNRTKNTLVVPPSVRLAGWPQERPRPGIQSVWRSDHHPSQTPGRGRRLHARATSHRRCPARRRLGRHQSGAHLRPV